MAANQHDPLTFVKDFLSDDDVRHFSLPELRTYLATQYGAPTEEEIAGGFVETRFRLPNSGLSIVERRDGGDVVGAYLFREKQSGGNCSTPGYAGRLTGVGTGTASSLIAIWAFLAYEDAVQKARAAASASFWALYQATATRLCPPPCFPWSTPVPPRPPTVTWTYRKLFGIPYRVVFTATAWQTEIISCI